MSKKKWTQEEEQQIFRMEREQRSASEMAEIFGVTAVEMLKKIHELRSRKEKVMNIRVTDSKPDHDIRRGEIYYVEHAQTDPETGSEQRSGRPAVIVSNDANNKASHVIEAVYLTTQEKTPLPTHVNINSSKYNSIALCEQIRSFDKSRIGDYMGTVSAAELEALDKALAISIGLSTETKDNATAAKMTAEDMAIVKAERDTYRRMYDQILERLFTAG